MIPSSTPPPPAGIKKYVMVFITYVACASFHASREAYVAVKGDFQRKLNFPTQLLGVLDTTFLVCYGVGLLFSGSIGARFGNKKVASVGLFGTAIVMAMHGFLSKGWLVAIPNSREEAWTQGLGLYVLLVACNGLIQSLGFPNLVAVTSGWVAPTQRGLILGLWSTTGAAGDIIGLNVATFVLGSDDLKWQSVFFAVSGYLLVMTVVLVLAVEDRGVTSDGADTTRTDGKTDAKGEQEPLLDSAKDSDQKTHANVLSGLKDAWAIPGVLDWSMSYFFIKTVTYTILFWMPYYLTLTLDSQATADNLTVLFDVSMIFGTTCLGVLTDKLGGARSPLFVASFVIGSLPLLFLPALRQSTFHYAAAFVVTGMLSGGPAHMYGTAVSVDLGEAAAASGAPGLVSSLSGLIDGIGTLGAAVGQSIVAKVASDGELTRSQSDIDTFGHDMPSNAVLTGTYISTGDIAEDEKNGFTDAKFKMPDGMAVDTNGLPLYVETEEHHAGGTKKGIAQLVTEMLAGDLEVAEEQAAANSMATSSGDVDMGATQSASQSSGLGDMGSEQSLWYSSPKINLAHLGDVDYDGGEGSQSEKSLSETVDDGFQQRWSRVFFMLFAFNLLAAATLLRVAWWELKRLGWFGKAESAKVTAKRP